MSQETNLLKKCGLCPKGPEERIGIQETIFYDDPSDELKVTGIEYACGLGKELGAGCDLPEAYAMIAGIFKKA
jgi:hypothetical protein